MVQPIPDVFKPILWASVAIASFAFLGFKSVEKIAQMKAEESLENLKTPEIIKKASLWAAQEVKQSFETKIKANEDHIRDNENRILQAEIKAVSASAKAQDAKAIASQALSVGQDAHFKAGVALDKSNKNSRKITKEINMLTGD